MEKSNMLREGPLRGTETTFVSQTVYRYESFDEEYIYIYIFLRKLYR